MGGTLVERKIVFAPLLGLPEFVEMGSIERSFGRYRVFGDSQCDD